MAPRAISHHSSATTRTSGERRQHWDGNRRTCLQFAAEFQTVKAIGSSASP
jgi:hypothetical protein